MILGTKNTLAVSNKYNSKMNYVYIKHDFKNKKMLIIYKYCYYTSIGASVKSIYFLFILNKAFKSLLNIQKVQEYVLFWNCKIV